MICDPTKPRPPMVLRECAPGMWQFRDSQGTWHGIGQRRRPPIAAVARLLNRSTPWLEADTLLVPMLVRIIPRGKTVPLVRLPVPGYWAVENAEGCLRPLAPLTDPEADAVYRAALWYGVDRDRVVIRGEDLTHA